MKLDELNISNIDTIIANIDDCFGKLEISVDRDIQNQLEYLIYRYSNEVSNIKRVYTRNAYKLQQAKDKEFIKQRKQENSDLVTTKKVNKDFQEQNTYISLQEDIVDRLEDKKEYITRLANHINSMRIADLADAKRNAL